MRGVEKENRKKKNMPFPKTFAGLAIDPDQEPLGVGQYGTILSTNDATKVVKWVEDPADVDTIEEEAAWLRECAACDHVVRLYDAASAGPVCGLVLERADHDLYSALHGEVPDGPFTPALLRTYSLHLYRALAFLADRKIAHLDLKPENLLVCDGVLKLCDFGTAGREGEASCGGNTACYRAPEVVLKASCGTASDVWSAACIVYEMLTAALGTGPYYLFDTDETVLLGRVEDEEDEEKKEDITHLYLIREIAGDFPHQLLHPLFFDRRGRLRDVQGDDEEERRALAQYLDEDGVSGGGEEAWWVENVLAPTLRYSKRPTAKELLAKVDELK